MGPVAIGALFPLILFALISAWPRLFTPRWIHAGAVLLVGSGVYQFIGQLGLPVTYRAAGATFAMLLYALAFGHREWPLSNAWPRPYRWRREVDRTMKRERDARHTRR